MGASIPLYHGKGCGTSTAQSALRPRPAKGKPRLGRRLNVCQIRRCNGARGISRTQANAIQIMTGEYPVDPKYT